VKDALERGGTCGATSCSAKGDEDAGPGYLLIVKDACEVVASNIFLGTRVGALYCGAVNVTADADNALSRTQPVDKLGYAV